MAEQLVFGASGSDTLDDALRLGQGVERPFCCPVHGDSHASASVNVLLGVWFCHACHAKGRVDDKRAPSIDDLEAMMRPELPVRAYPEEWLGLYGYGGYWLSRFPEWLCWKEHLGQDPFTDEATFPVRTPLGVLAGVGRRRDGEPRYLYPKAWSAGATFAGTAVTPRWDRRRAVVVLVEGFADMTAVREVGASGYGCFGAGLHHPQRELLARMNPQLVIAAFDADGAGRRANERAVELLGDTVPVVALDWASVGVKDPAEASPAVRLAALTESVTRAAYRDATTVLAGWANNIQIWQQAYRLHREE